MYIGIDDATRCPVIGSLFVAGVLADRKAINHFKKIGVKDSKLLTKSKRFKLFEEILKHSNVAVTMITPECISKDVNLDGEILNLNDKEMIAYLSIVNRLNTDDVRIIVDNFEHSREGFVKRAEKYKKYNWNKWIIEHDADKKYTIVGAASIVAKCYSDMEFDYLNEKYNLGSGNPNDSKTIEFIKKHLNHKPKCQDGCQWIRWNWHTIKRLKGE